MQKIKPKQKIETELQKKSNHYKKIHKFNTNDQILKIT